MLYILRWVLTRTTVATSFTIVTMSLQAEKNPQFLYYGVSPANYYTIRGRPTQPHYFDNGTAPGIYYEAEDDPSIYTNFVYPSYPYWGVYYKNNYPIRKFR